MRNSGGIVIIVILIFITIIMIIVIIAHGYLMRWKLAVVIVAEFDELSPQDRRGWALPTITNIINHHHQHHHYHHHNRCYLCVLISFTSFGQGKFKLGKKMKHFEENAYTLFGKARQKWLLLWQNYAYDAKFQTWKMCTTCLEGRDKERSQEYRYCA